MLSIASLDALPNASRGAETVVVLMTSFNRRAKTLATLHSLRDQVVSQDIAAGVVLYDDGSVDGTAEAVAAAFPQVEIVRGDGSAFWSRGMAAAHARTLEVLEPDYLLWLNDDVGLDAHALDTLVVTARVNRRRSAVVGPLVDPVTGEVTYSGYARFGARPQQLRHVAPNGTIAPTDTFNGNVVLLPRAVYCGIGPIDARYEHSYGDTDYGYRMASVGLRAVMAPRFVGSCARNAVDGTWRDPTIDTRTRLALLVSRKGIPPRSYVHFQRRHGGHGWIVNVLGTYLAALREIYRSRRSATATAGEGYVVDREGSP